MGTRVRTGPIWQKRFYDFNVSTPKKRIEKLRYMHRNPVKRGLAEKPEDWAWSSFRHYSTGEEGIVEIESEWTGGRRERMGMPLRIKIRELPHPHDPLSGPPAEPNLMRRNRGDFQKLKLQAAALVKW